MALDVTECASRAEAMARAADELARSLEAGLAARGMAAAALSGGATPAPAYAALAARALPWPRVTFGLVDERWVAPGDPASNETMIRQALAPAIAGGARLVGLWSHAATPREGAALADQAYAACAFDAALMGMGADAHTASWFAGAEGLEAALDPGSARTVVAVRAPLAAGAADRLTLTRAALRRVGRIVLLITGADKRAALERAAGADPREAPVAALLGDDPGRLVILWAP